MGLKELDQRLVELGVRPEDLVERFTRSRGPGGQHVNKTSTAVQLSHIPSGIEIRAEDERSQLRNRIAARELLIARIEGLAAEKAAAEQDERERKRRRNRRPPLTVRRKRLADKRQRAEVKRRRGSVREGE
jgi:protein subunit release factor B